MWIYIYEVYVFYNKLYKTNLSAEISYFNRKDFFGTYNF